VVVFAVVGIGFESDLMVVERSIGTDRDVPDLDPLGFLMH
jgi:hypothetical protein